MHEEILNIIFHQGNTHQNHEFTPTRMAVIEKTDNNNSWWRCGEIGTFIPCWWEYQMVQPLWKTAWQLLKWLNIELPYDPAILSLDIYTENLKRCPHKNLFMNVHSSVTHNRPRWKPKCPSADEWINRVVYPYNGILTIRERTDQTVNTAWMSLENVMLSKRTGHKRPHIIWLHLLEMSTTGKSRETESKLSLPRAEGKGLSGNGGLGSIGSDSYGVWSFFSGVWKYCKIRSWLHNSVNILKPP